MTKFIKMLEYFKKWLYINDINNENLLKIAKIIEKENKKPEIFTSQAEVLYYFWLLIKNKISVKEFFLFNETSKNKFLFQYKYVVSNPIDGIFYVKFLPPKIKNNKIFIFDNFFSPLINKEKFKNTYVI